MLRIHFTADDLARVRLSRGWPLAETLFSLTRLRRTDLRDSVEGWAVRIGRMSSALTHPCAALFDSGPLDLMTMTGCFGSFEEELTAVLAVRPEHFRAELAAVAAKPHGRRPGWRATVGDPAGDRNDRLRLVTFLHDYHRVAVAPHWSQMQTRLAAEHAALTQVLGNHGVDGVLNALAPLVRWRSPVLEMGSGPSVSDVLLNGRGLLLVPSVFENGPALWVSEVPDESPAVLFLPVAQRPGDLAMVLADPSAVERLPALVNLLGRTRAHALDSIGDGPCTTGQLASRLAMSPASASEHASVLREAGLIQTVRQGRAVRHQLTALGEQLLGGMPVRSPS